MNRGETISYRDFDIERLDYGMPPLEFTYCHKDYDGPEDRRAGYAASLEEAKAEIDAWHSEQCGLCRGATFIKTQHGEEACPNCAAAIAEEERRERAAADGQFGVGA